MKKFAFAGVLLWLFCAPVSAQFDAQATYVLSSGTSAPNAFTILVPNVSQLTDLQGVPVCVMMSNGNTGASTLQVNSLAAVTISKPSPAGLVALISGDIVNAQQACFKYDGAVFELNTPNLNLATVQASSGFDVPINLQLNCTAAANALTCAVKAASINSDPTANSPVYVPFADSTTTSGDPVWRTITGAISFTFAGGNTAGCSSGAPCRLWITLIDNAGTVLLGLSNQSTASGVFALNEGVLQTTGSGTSGGSTAGTIYTSVSAITTKAVRIVGYVEWTTLATAGNWTAPNFVRLFGPGVKKPGDVVQVQRTQTGAVATGSTAGFPAGNDTIPTNTQGDQYQTQSITPTSAANVLRVTSQTAVALNAGGALGVGLFQDATTNALTTLTLSPGTNITANFNINFTAIANTTSATTFKIRAGNAAGNQTTFNGDSASRIGGGVLNSWFQIEEIMGAIDPANDNDRAMRMAG